MAKTKTQTQMQCETLPPSELFHYAAPHQVLICTSCRYAIQPHAVARHLKDIHHIYRSARQPYMAYANSLKLRDPEHVELPRPEQFPVPHLPVERGWKCAAAGCDYLCVSVKRMELHWSAAHGRKGFPADDWTSVLLQTFFRGNMLRYFTDARGDECDSAKSLQTRDPAASVDVGIVQALKKAYRLDQLDCLILDHYFSTSFRSFLLEDDALAPVWLEVVPGISLENPFLVHGILASTALHMAYLEPNKASDYTLRAMSHQEIALPLFRYAVDHPTSLNANALVAFGYLLTVYAFAADVSNTENPLFIVDDPGSTWGEKPLTLPAWLHFLRAGCVMLCDVWETIETGPVRILAYMWEVEMEVSQIGLEKVPYLNFFLSLIPTDSSWSDESISIYRTAATMLAESFAYMTCEGIQRKFRTWNVLSVWPVRLKDDYIALLTERHPAALILLAYYCVILKQINGLWFFEGRPAKLLASIIRVLDERWHPCIQEAVDQVMAR